MVDIALVGATGAVGQEVLQLLEKGNIPISKLRCFSSQRSQGKTIVFKGQELPLEVLSPNAFIGCDNVIFCAGSKISKE